MSDSNSDTRDSQIDILLNEYQSCHRNRNHYDSVRWTIGSIFIVASLTLFGLSLDKPIVIVILAYYFSWSLIMIWYFYSQHVNPYIMRSMIRMHEIEKKLRDWDFEINLHKSILAPEPKEGFTVKGTYHSLSILILVTIMWFFNISISIYRNLNWAFPYGIAISTIIFLIIPLVIISVLYKKFNAVNYVTEMKKNL
jgi:hypothetical protein